MEEILEVIVIRKRIKNMYLHITREGRVQVTAPLRMPDQTIWEFVEKKKDWIEKSLAKVPEMVHYDYVPGEMHYVYGCPAPLKLYRSQRNGGTLEAGSISLFLHSARTDRKKLYEQVAGESLLATISVMVRKWAPKMGVTPGNIKIRRVKSRWGSCNVKTHELTFSLDLFTKPRDLIESVVVHELNHLLEPGHGPRFHALMAHWLPDYKERSKKLNSFPREFV